MCLSGAMNVLSNGCSLCVEWGGKQIMATWNSLALTVRWSFLLWLLYPSTMSSTGSDADGFVTEKYCSNQSINISQLIEPDGWYLNTVPGEAPLVRRWFVFLSRKIIRGGTKIPVALKHTTTLIKEPLSATVKAPIWRLPLSARIFGCFFWTTVNLLKPSGFFMYHKV